MGVICDIGIGFMMISCSVDHFVITTEISSYEKSLDPEQCENILETIDSYNDHVCITNRNFRLWLRCNICQKCNSKIH